jgi:quinol monooxygenase YgiN
MKNLTTSEEVFWVVALKINPGQEAKFKALSEQLIESTKAEPGTLNYEWSLSEDGQTCHIYERYVDSAAAKVHLERSAPLVGQIPTVATRLGFTIYGAPSDEVKQILSSRGAAIMKPLGGFSR